MDLSYDNNILNIIGGSDETFESLRSLCVYDAAIEPYCINLVDKPRKILSNIFFTSFFHFSIAFTLVKRALNLFAVIIYVLSHSQAWKHFAEEFDKLLRALTASE